jgi:hypothetical protein
MFLVVLVLVAVLLHVGAASELVESAEELQQNAQRMIDERNEAVINIIADHLPELNREEVHKRRLFSHYTKYIGYYQFSTFLVNGKPSCAAGGAPLTATGVGYGCISLAPHSGSCPENLPCSFGNSCSESSDGVKIGGKLYMGKDCTGAVYSGPGAEQMEAAFDKLSAFPACKNGVKYTCAAAGGLPASLYNGYRVTTYWDSKTCMGNPISYIDYYDSASKSFTCENGQIWSKMGSTTTQVKQNTCTASPLSTDSSMSYGCVAAMPSLGTRDFTTFKMKFRLSGARMARRGLQGEPLPRIDWGNAANKIALKCSLAATLQVDCDAISSVTFSPARNFDSDDRQTNVDDDAMHVGLSRDRFGGTEIQDDDFIGPDYRVSFTVRAQDKFNTYSFGPTGVQDDDFSVSNFPQSMQKRASHRTRPDCFGKQCFSAFWKAFAPPSIRAQVPGIKYISSTSPSTIHQTPSGIVTADPAPASKGPDGTSGAGIAAAVVGGFVVVGGIGFYYYTQVYKPKLAKHVAEGAGMASAPQVQEASNPVHASSGAATSALPPPECPTQTI